MKSWVVALFSLVLACLIASSPVAAFASGWELAPGDHQHERLDLEGSTTLRVEVNLSSGSQVTMLLLDQANFLLFEANKTYEAVHESTTMDHLTVTVDVGAGAWYVVMFNHGSDAVQLHISITWESMAGGADLYVSPALLIAIAVVAAGIVAAYVLLKKKR